MLYFLKRKTHCLADLLEESSYVTITSKLQDKELMLRLNALYVLL